MIFSAKKSSPQPRQLRLSIEEEANCKTTQKFKLNDVSPAQTPKLADQNHISQNSHNELTSSSTSSSSSQVVAPSQETDSTSSAISDANSYCESNVHELVEISNHSSHNLTNKNSSNVKFAFNNINPTLATQEDMSDYITFTPQINEASNDREKSKLNKASPNSVTSMPKKIAHVRNPSLLSGTTAQTVQFINGAAISPYSGVSGLILVKCSIKNALSLTLNFNYKKITEQSDP